MFPICFPLTREVNFTVPWLDKLKAPAQREDYRDRSTKGLQLRVGTTGVRSFSYVYRIGRKMGRVSLGKYPDFSLKAARDKTNEYKKTIEKLRIGFYKDIIQLENYSYNLESKL